MDAFTNSSLESKKKVVPLKDAFKPNMSILCPWLPQIYENTRLKVNLGAVAEGNEAHLVLAASAGILLRRTSLAPEGLSHLSLDMGKLARVLLPDFLRKCGCLFQLQLASQNKDDSCRIPGAGFPRAGKNAHPFLLGGKKQYVCKRCWILPAGFPST